MKRNHPLLEKYFINLAGNCTMEGLCLVNFFDDRYFIIYRIKITKTHHMVTLNFTGTDFDITFEKQILP